MKNIFIIILLIPLITSGQEKSIDNFKKAIEKHLVQNSKFKILVEQNKIKCQQCKLKNSFYDIEKNNECNHGFPNDSYIYYPENTFSNIIKGDLNNDNKLDYLLNFTLEGPGTQWVNYYAIILNIDENYKCVSFYNSTEKLTNKEIKFLEIKSGIIIAKINIYEDYYKQNIINKKITKLKLKHNLLIDANN